MDVGILSYGIWIPRHRIATEEIARVWGKDGVAMAAGLGVKSKSVPTVKLYPKGHEKAGEKMRKTSILKQYGIRILSHEGIVVPTGCIKKYQCPGQGQCEYRIYKLQGFL